MISDDLTSLKCFVHAKCDLDIAEEERNEDDKEKEAEVDDKEITLCEDDDDNSDVDSHDDDDDYEVSEIDMDENTDIYVDEHENYDLYNEENCDDDYNCEDEYSGADSLLSKLPDNPERFCDRPFVQGFKGFDSGSHWDTEVSESADWTVGIIEKPVRGSKNHIWKIGYVSDHYEIGSPTQSLTILSVKDKLQKIRVDLNWDTGKVSFSDPLTHICTHSLNILLTESFQFF